MASERERGQALALTAVVFAFVLLPLMALLFDGARLYHIRTRLATATDAACEDAAYSAADYAAYRDTGTVTYRPGWYVIGVAHSTFQNTLSEQYRMRYAAAILVEPDYVDAVVHCTASASVPLLMLPVTDTLSVSTESAIRFR